MRAVNVVAGLSLAVWSSAATAAVTPEGTRAAWTVEGGVNAGLWVQDQDGAPAHVWTGNPGRSPVVAADVDGDGTSEWVLVEQGATSSLLVLSSVGQERWRMALGAAAVVAPVLVQAQQAGGALVAVVDVRHVLRVGTVGSTSLRRVPLQGAGEPVDAGELSAMAQPVLVRHQSGAVDLVVALPDGRVVRLDSNLQARQGWPVTLGARVLADMAVVTSPSGGEDVAVADGNGRVHLLSSAGTERQGFPVALGAAVLAPLALRDERISQAAPGILACSMAGRCALLTLQGEMAPGWPVELGAPVSAAPLVADVDGDASPDVVVVDEAGQVRAWGADAQQLSIPDVAPVPVLAVRGVGLISREASVVLLRQPFGSQGIVPHVFAAPMAVAPQHVMAWTGAARGGHLGASPMQDMLASAQGAAFLPLMQLEWPRGVLLVAPEEDGNAESPNGGPDAVDPPGGEVPSSPAAPPDAPQEPSVFHCESAAPAVNGVLAVLVLLLRRRLRRG